MSRDFYRDGRTRFATYRDISEDIIAHEPELLDGAAHLADIELRHLAVRAEVPNLTFRWQRRPVDVTGAQPVYGGEPRIREGMVRFDYALYDARATVALLARD